MMLVAYCGLSLAGRALVADDDDGSSGDPDAVTLKQADESEFRLVLSSGRVIDVGTTFLDQRKALEAALRRRLRSSQPVVFRVNHDGSDRPMLLASRRGKLLDGPFASFTEEGKPIACVDYSKGQRDSTLQTWDEQGRPLVFAEYQLGKIHGLRCVFQACCEDCKSGHLWMVQEWEQGQLLATHLVRPDGDPISVNHRYGQPAQVDSEFELATSELARFESRFDSDEQRLKQWLTWFDQQQRQASAYRSRLAANQRRYRLLSALNAKHGYSALPVRRVPV
jgi:hypothetical protein